MYLIKPSSPDIAPPVLWHKTPFWPVAYINGRPLIRGQSRRYGYGRYGHRSSIGT